LVELQQKCRQTLHAMSREIRQSETSGLTLTGTDDLSFSITDDINDPANPVTYDLRYYFDAANNRLVRENPAGPVACDATWNGAKCAVLVADVSALTFRCLDGTNPSPCANADTVQIDLENSKTVLGRVLTLPLTKKVYLRNE